MIKTKDDFQNYIRADRIRYDIKFSIYHPFIYSETYYVYHYLKNLRNLEYYHNTSRNIFKKILYYYFLLNHRRLSLKTGMTISPNVLGKGCLIMHPGFRRIGPSSKIGDNCTILPNVLLGKKYPGKCSIEIGDNCYIATNVTILGPVKIGNNVTIGAGAVVLSDIPDNAVVAGVPARVIKYKNENYDD